MKILYLECSMGAAGDMLTAALYELLGNNDKKAFLKQINSLGLNNVRITAQPIEKNLIKGTKVHVKIHGYEEHEKNSCPTGYNNSHKHSHTSLKTIGNIISKLKVSKKVKDNAVNIYNIIAQAEAKAHHKSVTRIHFHEVGEIDAIIDIVSVCLLVDKVSPNKIISSPINIGKGRLHCAHGILSVPAPATANILYNIPIYTNEYEGELCTPTGAAIIKHFVTSFGQMPIMRIKKIGYGMGARKIEIPNCVRAFLGESDKDADTTSNTIAQLQCNLDDITGEALSFASELLLEKGALDVFYTSIQMKKNRPGVLFTCICEMEKVDFFAKLILEYTSTFGVRKTICKRYILNRKTSVQKTPYGNIRIKTGEGFGIKKSKPEFEDIVKVARIKNKTFDEIKKNIKLK
ncbi:MAG: nickel pincer cofactor biosynthesis protein LarC [Endomicrobium sp.]|jgi:uncharacterized protein (TIGR00299 family) protein|nr:nickel pincer cofactor biosynthesis protein LarC [Endomicrobium sp.]